MFSANFLFLKNLKIFKFGAMIKRLAKANRFAVFKGEFCVLILALLSNI